MKILFPLLIAFWLLFGLNCSSSNEQDFEKIIIDSCACMDKIRKEAFAKMGNPSKDALDNCIKNKIHPLSKKEKTKLGELLKTKLDDQINDPKKQKLELLDCYSKVGKMLY